VSFFPGQILVIRGGAVGDFILTLPALTALRKQFPGVRIEVLGYPAMAELARAAGVVDGVRSIEARALAGFFARKGQLDHDLQAYFARFSVIVSYLYDPDGIFQENLSNSSSAQFIAGPHRPDEKASIHATEVFLRPLERLTIFDADPVPRLDLASFGEASEPACSSISEAPFLPDARMQPASACLALHPGSGSERKNWPERKWAELLRELAAQTRIRFLLVGGEAEEGKLERLSRELPPERVSVARNLPLVQLAGLLSRAGVFVGHDSGISHLAAAVGLPVVALWADTSETIWKPRGNTVHLLKDPAGLAALPVSIVLNELLRLFGELHFPE
jgi:heptosyltransferase III